MTESVKEMGYCRWCLRVMPKGAVICTHCTMHQSALFERAKKAIKVATSVGLLASALASAIVFVWPFAQEWYYEQCTSQSLKVISFRAERNMVILNDGKIPVFASHIDARVDGFDRLSIFPIQEMLEPGEAIVVDTKSLYAKRAAADNLPAWNVVITAPESMYENLDRADLTLVYYADNDLEYNTILSKFLDSNTGNFAKRNVQDLNVKKANCLLHYASEAQGESTKEFACVAAIAQKDH